MAYPASRSVPAGIGSSPCDRDEVQLLRRDGWMDIYSNCESTFFFFFQQYNAVKSRSSAIFCVAIQTVKKDISSVWSGGLCCSVRDRCPDLLPQSLCLGTMTMSHYFPPLILRDIMCMTTRGHFTEESGSF